MYNIDSKLFEVDSSLGAYLPGKPGKVREFDVGRGKVRELRKSQGNCGLRVMWYLSFDSYEINNPSPVK